MSGQESQVARQGRQPLALLSPCNRQQGIIGIWVAMALLALLGMAAVTIDVGRLVLAKQELQDVADAAALASAATLREGMDVERAKQTAIDIAASNTILGQPAVLDPDVDVEVGAWDAELGQIVPWSAMFNSMAVQVTMRRTQDSPGGSVPLIFGTILGVDSVPMSASGAAGVVVSGNPREPVEIMVVQDGSGSFAEEWELAIDADFALVQLVNNVSIDDDATGFVAFNDEILQYGEEGWYKDWYKEWYKHWYWTGRRWRWYWDYSWEFRWKYGTVYADLILELTAYEEGLDLPVEVEEVYEHADATEPNGYTNPGIALDWAITEFMDHGNSECAQVIVLVSDGMPFGSTDGVTEGYRGYAIAQANRAEAQGIRIHTITLTSEEYGEYGYGGADFEFNQSLTRLGGYALRTHNPDHLQSLLITVGAIEIGSPFLFK